MHKVYLFNDTYFNLHVYYRGPWLIDEVVQQICFTKGEPFSVLVIIVYMLG